MKHAYYDTNEAVGHKIFTSKLALELYAKSRCTKKPEIVLLV